MRAKRQKVYKRAMHSYQTAFGFRTPYQILRTYSNRIYTTTCIAAWIANLIAIHL